MSPEQDPLALERSGWDALATDGDAARSYYGEVLADEVVFLLPGGMVIDDRRTAVESMGGAPWTSYELVDERLLDLGSGCAMVTYRAEAVRAGEPYRALVASTYVREADGWKLKVHQQTPC